MNKIDSWHKLKKDVDVGIGKSYKERGVWLCRLGVNIGLKQKDSGCDFLAVGEAGVEPKNQQGQEEPEEEKVRRGKDGLDWGTGINKFSYWQDMEAVGHDQGGGQK